MNPFLCPLVETFSSWIDTKLSKPLDLEVTGTGSNIFLREVVSVIEKPHSFSPLDSEFHVF